ncbi:MAG: ATP-binding protein [Granulosicoccus sp.]
MNLRSQMLLASVLTLLVPIVGWQSAKQLYAALQQTRVDDQALKVANMRLALFESPEVDGALDKVTAEKRDFDLYAEYSAFPLFLDGYADDWRNMRSLPVLYSRLDTMSDDEPVDGKLSVRAASRDSQLYLHITVVDDQLVYHEIPVLRADAGEGEQPDRWTRLVNGDSVELLVAEQKRQGGRKRVSHGLFRAIAPGPLTALQASDIARERLQARRKAGSPLTSWQAYWQKSKSGFQLEIQIPLPDSGSVIAVAFADIDTRGEQRIRWTGSANMQQLAQWNKVGVVDTPPGRIFYRDAELQRRLETWVTPGERVRLFDQQGRLVADINELYTREDLDAEIEGPEAFSSDGLASILLYRLFSFFIAGDLPLLPETRIVPGSLSLPEKRRASVYNDLPVTSRYVTDENDRVLGTLVSVGSESGSGYLLLEANEEHRSAYAGSRLARLFGLLLLVSFLTGSGLLMFALSLSSRIRRLSRQAHLAVSEDGRVLSLPDSHAKDEIGDLARQLAALLSRSQGYTSYLEALSGRLSHELRTPLSVVRTSIENLDMTRLDSESRKLIERASSGADQLSAIVKALVDSTRLEQIVLNADKQTVHLADWLSQCSDSYSQVYYGTSFVLFPEELPQVSVSASTELLRQALDKLVDNAVDFNQGTEIQLRLAVEGENSTAKVRLAVANRGKSIDESLVAELFSPLVSVRDKARERQHLGLGLYIVRLVAESSGGEVFAGNEEGWVVFGISLPVLKP